MKYALIAAIEGNGQNINNNKGLVKFERKLESEAILCFTSWRQNGGWLKDIPIYAVCPTKNVISDETKERLKELNVTYIEEYHDITETFTSGFLNIPFVGSLMEDRLDEDVLIKIDLDMNLIKPLPPELVNSEITVCGQYDDYCTKQQRTLEPGWANPFDTGFMITRRVSDFYKLWFYETAQILSGKVIDPEWEKVKKVTGEYYLEEYVVDKIYHQSIKPIRPIQRYQIGEWYTPVSLFSDNEINSIYFWHEHIIYDPEYNRIREKVEFFNRTNKINKINKND